MRGIHEPEPFLQEALVEHHELHRAVMAIRHRLATRPSPLEAADLAAAKESILQLRRKLDHHFLQEEDGGYLEEAVGRVPSLAPTVATLQRQHHEFLGELDAILARSEGITSLHGAWYFIKLEFERLSNRLFAHEAAENALLSRAFNVDLTAEKF